MADNNYSATSSAVKEDELQKIDLFRLLNDVFKGIRALWWLPIILFLIFAAKSFFLADRSYTPFYSTSGTVYVSMTDESDSYQNELTAEQMEKLFPYMMSNGLLTDAIKEDMGLDYLPGSITATVDGYTNLMTFTVNGDDPKAIHELLLSTIKVYPKLIEFIAGPTQFRLFKDMGVPTEPANQPVNTFRLLKASVKSGLKYFLVGLVLICLYGLSIRSITSRDEMKRYLNASCFGALPETKLKKRSKNNKSNQLTIDSDRTPYAFQESVRMIRNRVEREAGRQQDRVLMVTSTVPGEGKTTVAVNLSLALAKAGRRVLLIDGDMRNPSVAGALRINAEHGLSEVLHGEEKLDDCIVKLPDSDLFLLTAGKTTTESSDLLSNAGMEAIIKQVRDYADFVIIDTPPVMVLGDSIAVGKYVDDCIYVVRSGHARRSMIINGISQLNDSGINVLGTVLNGDKSASSNYGSGYGKYGTYGYGSGKKRYGSYSSYYGDSKKDK